MAMRYLLCTVIVKTKEENICKHLSRIPGSNYNHKHAALKKNPGWKRDEIIKKNKHFCHISHFFKPGC